MSGEKRQHFGGFIFLNGDREGEQVQLAQLPFRIGRLAENDLVLLDDQVSRQHAEVRLDGERLVLVDLKSRNGVIVDGKRVSRLGLTSGVELRLGKADLRYEDRLAISKPSPSRREVPNVQAYEEPTAARFRLNSLSEKTYQSSISAIQQCAKLFGSKLGLEGILRQILRVFFQAYMPERCQIIWKGTKQEVILAKSRAEGDEAVVFHLPESLLESCKGRTQALHWGIEVGGETQKRSVLVAPLRSRGAVRGWIYADRTEETAPYGNDEAVCAEALALVVGGVLERLELLKMNANLDEKQRLLERHLSSEVVERISSKEIRVDESDLALEEKEITILFSDIVGFTTLSERLQPSEIATLLSEYLRRMVETVERNEGMVNKFIGDAVMALFGAPESRGEDALHAVRAAWEMLQVLKEFNQKIDSSKQLRIRIGINTGNVVAGEIGSERRVEYTVLGDAVNLASRLESISLENAVTIGPKTAEQVKHAFELEKVSGVQVKGKTESIDVFRVAGPKKIDD